MKYTIHASCGCFIGTGRDHNEDNICFDKRHLPQVNKGLKRPLKMTDTTDEPTLFAVFDGMGGGRRGEEASCLCAELFSEELKKLEELAVSGKEFLLRACERANAAVNADRESKQVSSMGTTVAALYLFQDEAVACNMGDSKIFRIRDGQMLQISEDHTDEKLLETMGIKKKPVLLQYLGVPDTEMAIEPYVSKGDLRAGDAYLLCSDGVTDVLSVAEMYEWIRQGDAEEAVRLILAEVDRSNGSDNATAIVIKIEG